jgi:hypothetical protein
LVGLEVAAAIAKTDDGDLLLLQGTHFAKQSMKHRWASSVRVCHRERNVTYLTDE